MALNSKSLYYATLSLGVFTFVALSCLALSGVDRQSSLIIAPTLRRSLSNITTICPTTPPGSNGYEVHLSHINNTIEEFCSLPHLQKTTFVPAIYTFPPWPGVRSLFPSKGEGYPFPEAVVRFAIGFSDDQTLEGKCADGWAFDRRTCIKKLRKQWEGSCNITTTRAMPDPATIQAMASISHQPHPPMLKRQNQNTTTILPEDSDVDCVSFHLTPRPSTTIPSASNTTPTTANDIARPKPRNFHLDGVYTDSSKFSMDKEVVACRPERKDLKDKERGWCVCWIEGLEGQRRKFWPANGDMLCWNLMPRVWRPGVGEV